MSKVQIASLYEVVKNIDFIKRNDINLISIRNTEHTKDYDIIDGAGLKNLLVVYFDDILEPLPDRSEKPPEEEDIVKIINWTKQKMQENNNGFIIHCTAGVSRSSAVAIIVKYLQDPQNALKVINPILHCPNERVLDLGEKILNTKDIKEPAKKMMKEYDESFIKSLEERQDKTFNFQKK